MATCGTATEIIVYSQYPGDLPRFRKLLDYALPGRAIAYVESEAEARPHLATTRVLYGWGFPIAMLREMPKLEWIQMMGAGVEDVVRDWRFGTSVLLTRTDGRVIAPRMVEYVLCAVLRRSLELYRADELRANRRWAYFELGSVRRHTVGVAGLGAIGAAIAKALRGVGARVIGWRKSAAPCDSVERVYVGREELQAFLAESSVIVLVLPITAETFKLIDSEAFSSMKPGAHLVNVGRGGVVDEEALIQAMNRGVVSHATLDVFATEPLPPAHPFWTDPRVSITPHLCGPLIAEDVAPHFIENFRAFSERRPLNNVITPEREY